jgi:hypothetical protein
MIPYTTKILGTRIEGNVPLPRNKHHPPRTPPPPPSRTPAPLNSHQTDSRPTTLSNTPPFLPQATTTRRIERVTKSSLEHKPPQLILQRLIDERIPRNSVPNHLNPLPQRVTKHMPSKSFIAPDQGLRTIHEKQFHRLDNFKRPASEACPLAPVTKLAERHSLSSPFADPTCVEVEITTSVTAIARPATAMPREFLRPICDWSKITKGTNESAIKPASLRPLRDTHSFGFRLHIKPESSCRRIDQEISGSPTRYKPIRVRDPSILHTKRRSGIFLLEFPPSRPTQIRTVFVNRTSCMSLELI